MDCIAQQGIFNNYRHLGASTESPFMLSYDSSRKDQVCFGWVLYIGGGDRPTALRTTSYAMVRVQGQNLFVWPIMDHVQTPGHLATSGLI